MERPLALVVDRDPTVRELIGNALERHDLVARSASSGAETMDALRSRPVRIAVVDVDTPGVDAEGLLSYATQLQPAPVVIAVTAAEEGERAQALIDRGAFDILCRPLEAPQLRVAVQRAVRYRDLLDETHRLRVDLQSREGYHGIVGRSQPIERLREQLDRLAAGDASIWFHGETGTGKELGARMLHAHSKRSGGRFVALSCAGLDASAWDGALGRADAGVPAEGGALAAASGGTLYLDDLPALVPDLQSRLSATLDALAGGASDVRVLASSSSDPASLAAQGRVIEELQRRLAGHSIGLPPLRERAEDIPLLASHFIATICAINRLAAIQLAPEALELLSRYHWPDNVQGLRNAMEQAVILSVDGRIYPRDLPDRVRETATPTTAPAGGEATRLREFRDAKREVVEAFERTYLSALMERFGGNVTAASQRAGMLRSALQRLLRKYGLKSASFRRQRAATKPEEATRPER
jgi:DNA-binding NtrC family response regulator